MSQLYEPCPPSRRWWEELSCVLWATGWAACGAERGGVLARGRVLLLPESGEWGKDALQQLIQWKGQDILSVWLVRHLITLLPSWCVPHRTMLKSALLLLTRDLRRNTFVLLCYLFLTFQAPSAPKESLLKKESSCRPMAPPCGEEILFSLPFPCICNLLWDWKEQGIFPSTFGKTRASLTESTGGNFKPLKCTADYNLFTLENCLPDLRQAITLEHGFFCLRMFTMLKEFTAIARYLSY